MSEHTPTPWSLRPRTWDDWGWIRGADGELACIARRHDLKDDDKHRIDKTDPYQANAAFIVEAVNSYDALKHDIERHIRIASEAVTERDRLREQVEHYERGRKNTQIEMDEREAEVERLSNQLVRCETALKIVSSEDAGFLGQTARAALVPALSDDLIKGE